MPATQSDSVAHWSSNRISSTTDWTGRKSGTRTIGEQLDVAGSAAAAHCAQHGGDIMRHNDAVFQG